MNSEYGAIRYVDADAIGESLKRKFGVGYAPVDWTDKVDLLIPIDTEVVPVVLPDEEGSMKDRYGAIELSVLDSVGAKLEEKLGSKYSVGEWASVIDSMAYAEEVEVTGSVITVTDAIESPILSWVVKVG